MEVFGIVFLVAVVATMGYAVWLRRKRDRTTDAAIRGVHQASAEATRALETASDTLVTLTESLEASLGRLARERVRGLEDRPSDSIMNRVQRARQLADHWHVGMLDARFPDIGVVGGSVEDPYVTMMDSCSLVGDLTSELASVLYDQPHFAYKLRLCAEDARRILGLALRERKAARVVYYRLLAAAEPDTSNLLRYWHASGCPPQPERDWDKWSFFEHQPHTNPRHLTTRSRNAFRSKAL